MHFACHTKDLLKEDSTKCVHGRPISVVPRLVASKAFAINLGFVTRAPAGRGVVYKKYRSRWIGSCMDLARPSRDRLCGSLYLQLACRSTLPLAGIIVDKHIPGASKQVAHLGFQAQVALVDTFLDARHHMDEVGIAAVQVPQDAPHARLQPLGRQVSPRGLPIGAPRSPRWCRREGRVQPHPKRPLLLLQPQPEQGTTLPLQLEFPQRQTEVPRECTAGLLCCFHDCCCTRKRSRAEITEQKTDRAYWRCA